MVPWDGDLDLAGKFFRRRRPGEGEHKSQKKWLVSLSNAQVAGVYNKNIKCWTFENSDMDLRIARIDLSRQGSMSALRENLWDSRNKSHIQKEFNKKQKLADFWIPPIILN